MRKLSRLKRTPCRLSVRGVPCHPCTPGGDHPVKLSLWQRHYLRDYGLIAFRSVAVMESSDGFETIRRPGLQSREERRRTMPKTRVYCAGVLVSPMKKLAAAECQTAADRT